MGASSKEMRSHLNIPINRLLHPRKIVVRVVDMVSWCSLKQTRMFSLANIMSELDGCMWTKRKHGDNKAGQIDGRDVKPGSNHSEAASNAAMEGRFDLCERVLGPRGLVLYRVEQYRGPCWDDGLEPIHWITYLLMFSLSIHTCAGP
ncbi:hypothetical protein F2Q68_00038916 [Brassica cretica]|uniref:Uncharacterized protein n=2 Tax=Brassica cretica TaxID=69181 RepID=A0A8S9MPE9_BRACR|nr:hypothetical protein F2Q68_00038916 [Brassica cretica]KAF3496508.1 hypothetical protein DY000_02052483 [Brassica cretica]